VKRLALVLLASCGPVSELPYDCATYGDVYLSGSMDCDGLHAHLERIEKAFHAKGFRTTSMRRWSVQVRPELEALHVAGRVFCDWMLVEVTSDDWHASAVAHEYAHTLDDCRTQSHEGWDTDGRTAAITEVNHPPPVTMGTP
jgi:hypothetical protein